MYKKNVFLKLHLSYQFRYPNYTRSKHLKLHQTFSTFSFFRHIACVQTIGLIDPIAHISHNILALMHYQEIQIH